ncbi:alpha/beta hydrolase family protein [Phytobacter sp. V91]|uniref:alpha/beta hydrolase family protein n=1 Tax=Phytobacter sp. V91 TaxID=3369425 RepID=UPI003F61D84E
MSRCYALFLLVLVGISAHAGTPLLWNQPAVKENCPSGDDSLWVEYPAGQACIRYFSAGNLKAAAQALVIFRGDRTSLIKRPPETIPANTADDQRRQAQTIARQSGLPTLIVARPGTYGSSGNHYRRRQQEEFLALNAALDAIKTRYGIQHFILSGHSGGATAASALLAFGRRDIDCAVLTSGAWGLLERAERIRQQRGESPAADLDVNGLANPWDPLDHIAGVAKDPRRLILVIGNPQDRNTPFFLQERYAQALRKQGHQVMLLERPAVAPLYHDLKGNPGVKEISLCPLRGRALNQ